MPSRHLPDSPDLDALRTHARRLQRAARAGDPEALRQIVWAAAQGRVDAVRLLLDLGLDIDALGRADVPVEGRWETALHAAVSADAPDVVTLLLRRGADTTIRDKRFEGTAADWAEYLGRPDIAMLLRDGPG